MQRLNVNPLTLAMALGALKGTPEELGYLTGQLTRSCQTELSLYGSTPPADAPPEVVQAAAAAHPEWGDQMHPHVIGQVLVDLCERTSQPIPDNLFVYVGNDWVALHNVQPNAPAKPAAPPTPPAPAVTPAQMASPAPVELTRTEVMGATILSTPPVPMPEQPLLPTAITLEGLIEQALPPTAQVAHPPVPDLIEDAQIVAQQPAAPQPAPTPQPAPQATTEEPVVRGQYGLPDPTVEAPKGKSPFDTDPGGKLPTSAPDRILRDMVALTPQLFNLPAATLVKGDGKGIPQRTRAFMALLALVDLALASAPDDTTPVGYLRHHLAHLRYNASQSAAGPTMVAFEQYVFGKPTE